MSGMTTKTRGLFLPLPASVSWFPKDETLARGDEPAIHVREACVANAVKQRLYSAAIAAAGAMSLTMFTVTHGLSNARELAAFSPTGVGEYVPPSPHITLEPPLLYVVRAANQPGLGMALEMK